MQEGDIEALNPGMVEAMHRAKWPLQELATKPECGPDLSPQEVLHKGNLKALKYLKSAGTCKPEGEL